MSINVEHLFSRGHLLLSHVHSRLSVQSTHTLLCLGIWSKLKLIQDANVKAVSELPEALDGEEGFENSWDTIRH